MARQGFRIADCDMHVIEPHDLWLEYLPPRWRERAPQIAQVPDTETYTWSCEGRFLPAFTDHPKRQRLNQKRYDQAQDKFRRYASAMKRRFDAKSQLEAMDVEGIDVAIAFRTIGSHVIAFDDIDPRFSAALCRAFNQWLHDRCAEEPRRLKAAAIVPAQDVALAVEEATHAVRELGHVAIVLPSNPVSRRPWYDDAYDPLWRTACELDVPVAFHGLQGAYQEHLGNRYLDNLMLMHASGHPMELMLAMGGLITGGVFDRFPALRAAFLEGSCSWLPWWLWRLDEEWEKLGHADRVKLRALPSEIFHQHCFVACDPDETLVPDVVEKLGADSLVVSTDWPHDDSLYPEAMDTFFQLDLPDEARRKILWDNSARLYGLG